MKVPAAYSRHTLINLGEFFLPMNCHCHGFGWEFVVGSQDDGRTLWANIALLGSTKVVTADDSVS